MTGASLTGEDPYRALAHAAARLIQDKGRGLTLRRQLRSFDPSTGELSTLFDDRSAQGVFGAYSEEQLDGTAIQRGDQRLLLAAEGLLDPPSAADVVLDGDDIWQVLHVEQVRPGNRTLLYRLQVRR